MEVKAKKSLGQHFLTDRNIAMKICSSLDAPLLPETLEIGCGMGILTQYLLQRDDTTIYGAEIDGESIEYLNEHFPEFRNRLWFTDFLKMDLGEKFPKGVNIIGNFPYNISSQIFFRIIEFRSLIPLCVGMVQKEVAQRIAEPPGSRTYGILSVLLQAWYDIEYLFTVSEGVFSPPPKVKSAVIRLRRNNREKLECDEALFIRVVKASFSQRRKMIRNSLVSYFPSLKGKDHPFFSKRAEDLSVDDFISLTNFISTSGA
ncbi:MAG: 16S rRNA (adenine(1518)-N(6)/adenine(1519)-N(6))-dimethyltransferase RsmA [Alistipes sp.]|nr:16S rRNA (adenine(1518)-N(6)/adenine(1519)-N(6))-dimethyltransferase RsmA [Candidatus Alistipes equi]